MKAKIKLVKWEAPRHKHYSCGCICHVRTCPGAAQLWERITNLYRAGVPIYSPAYIAAKRAYSEHFNAPYIIQ